MDYVELTLVTEAEDHPIAPSNTFISQLNSGTVSTFGTIKDTHQVKQPLFPASDLLVLPSQSSLRSRLIVEFQP